MLRSHFAIRAITSFLSTFQNLPGMHWILAVATRLALPDSVIRFALRRLFARRVAALERSEERSGNPSDAEAFREHTDSRPASPPDPEDPPAAILGPLGLTCTCYWPRWAQDLPRAEEEILELVCERAQVEDGMRLLVLAAGDARRWISEQYPACHIDRSSNVDTLLSPAIPAPSFDRILILEALDGATDLRPWMSRVAERLAPGGKSLVQLRCHRRYSYRYSKRDEHRWLQGEYRAGTLLPSTDLLPEIATPLTVEKRWEMSGEHYERTAGAWLRNFEEQAAQKPGNQAGAAARRLHLSLVARAEMFGFREGQEWWTSQYLLVAPL